VVIFQASASKAFREAALIAPVAVEEDSVAAVIDLAAAGPAGLAGSAAAAAGSEAGDETNAWNFPIFFLEKLKP
jgi:hypothetical protein